jgi:RNA polymerase sigma-70 factor (sigma-E family)
VTATVDEAVTADRTLEAVFRDHHAALVRLAFVLTGDRALADDLVQDAFVRFQRARAWPAPDAERAYLRRTVVNLSHGHHRHLAVVRRWADHDRALDAAPAADTGAEDHERRALVAGAVRRLPPRQRDCVVLHYYVGLSDAEIAGDLGISAGSVKTHLHRARAALADRLGSLR